MPMPRHSIMKVVPADDEVDDTRLTFEKLDGLLGYRLRRAQGAMHRDYIAAVAGLDLTQKQTATLWLIHANPGAAQVSVAAALGMDRATMMSVIDRLEDRRLLVRKRSTSDRRRQALYLTAEGEDILRKVKARIAKHEERFKAMFSAQELDALLAALQKFQQG
jgi:MarR family transcriptional regulator, organic hydroperoxide resistance regulator